MEMKKSSRDTNLPREIKITRYKELPGQAHFDFYSENVSSDEEERRRQLRKRDLLELIHFVEDSIKQAKPFNECVLDDPIREDLNNKGINLEGDPYE